MPGGGVVVSDEVELTSTPRRSCSTTSNAPARSTIDGLRPGRDNTVTTNGHESSRFALREKELLGGGILSS